MDLQKEREAFEATQNPIVFERIVYIEKANLFTMKDDFRDDLFTMNKCNELNFGWSSWQAAKAKAIPDGYVLVPEVLTHEQAARISDDENFFETYQTILTESDTSEDSAVILIQTAHKAMIEALEQDYESK